MSGVGKMTRRRWLKKRQDHRTLEELAEAIGCSTHSVKDWVTGKNEIHDDWWARIEKVVILESVTASEEERVRIIALVVDATSICGSSAALSRRLGITVQHVSKLRSGKCLPTAEHLSDLERVVGRDLRPESDRGCYSTDRRYEQRWKYTVVGAINEYAKRYRDEHAEEYRRIDRMRNMDICWPGACVKCDMECTARTSKHQATQPARLQGNTGRRYQRA